MLFLFGKFSHIEFHPCLINSSAFIFKLKIFFTGDFDGYFPTGKDRDGIEVFRPKNSPASAPAQSFAPVAQYGCKTGQILSARADRQDLRLLGKRFFNGSPGFDGAQVFKGLGLDKFNTGTRNYEIDRL